MEKAVVTIGASGIIRSANQCAVIMFGYTRPNELIGQNVSVLCPHPYKEQHDSYLQHYHETGVPKVSQLSLSLSFHFSFFYCYCCCRDIFCNTCV